MTTVIWRFFGLIDWAICGVRVSGSAIQHFLISLAHGTRPPLRDGEPEHARRHGNNANYRQDGGNIIRWSHTHTRALAQSPLHWRGFRGGFNNSTNEFSINVLYIMIL
jgi:hypothetical protein